ncbi:MULTISPECIES: hypothetical protein [Fusobacterium]|uniref:hypothetical protein n=1 Tax=Fusobacterium TaxID=848 RepID=UPI0008A11F9F|nr:hypothetical protein [Fusobacterium sp. HMSC064B11]OFO24882.1 hypothetical protein HMPREF3051_00110 [Fusobacterium sp. HMSC064B11]
MSTSIDKIFNDLINELEQINESNNNIIYNTKALNKVVEKLEQSLIIQKNLQEELEKFRYSRLMLEKVTGNIENNIAKSLINSKEISTAINNFKLQLEELYKDLIYKAKEDINNYINEELKVTIITTLDNYFKDKEIK